MRLRTADPALQSLMHAVITEVDCTVLCGHRDQTEQEAAFAAGKSKEHWPNSKHNSTPSKAVDIAPYPIDWTDLKRFQALLEVVQRKANEQGVKVRFGRDFSTLHDWPHVELA
jgi:MarR-like DNA-binding transcriptional regulator SgrR of sgrS sRNA